MPSSETLKHVLYTATAALKIVQSVDRTDQPTSNFVVAAATF